MSIEKLSILLKWHCCGSHFEESLWSNLMLVILKLYILYPCYEKDRAAFSRNSIWRRWFKYQTLKNLVKIMCMLVLLYIRSSCQQSAEQSYCNYLLCALLSRNSSQYAKVLLPRKIRVAFFLLIFWLEENTRDPSFFQTNCTFSYLNSI